MSELTELLATSKTHDIRTTLDAVRALQDTLPEYKVKPRTGMIYGEQIKYLGWTFDSKKYKTIELLHITDPQYGHVECKVNRLIEYRDWVMAEPNRFVFFGGDMIDSANVLSVGSPWENIFSADRQVYKFCELMAPMRDRILGYVGGNHERRGLKTYGDLGVAIAMLLRIPYSGGQQFIDINFGKHAPFKTHLFHGKGAAQTKGAKVMMLYKFMTDNPGSHLYLVGHLHDCFILPCVRAQRVPEKLNVHMEKYIGGMSSSFLNYFGTYAEMMALSPTDCLMIRTILEPTGKWEATIR